MTAKDPKLHAAESHVARMLRGKRQGVRVQLPVRDGTIDVVLKPLTCGEIQRATAQAYERLRELGIPFESVGAAAEGHLHDEQLTQVLFLATRDPENEERPLCVTADEFRDTFEPDERAALWDLYETHFGDIDPDLNRLTDDQVRLITEAVKKKDTRSLKEFGWRELVTYLLISASPPST